jgi:hypothetical protein
MKAGHWAAALVIQRRGCQYPVECDFGKNWIKVTPVYFLL